MGTWVVFRIEDDVLDVCQVHGPTTSSFPRCRVENVSDESCPHGSVLHFAAGYRCLQTHHTRLRVLVDSQDVFVSIVDDRAAEEPFFALEIVACYQADWLAEVFYFERLKATEEQDET